MIQSLFLIFCCSLFVIELIYLKIGKKNLAYTCNIKPSSFLDYPLIKKYNLKDKNLFTFVTENCKSAFCEGEEIKLLSLGKELNSRCILAKSIGQNLRIFADIKYAKYISLKKF